MDYFGDQFKSISVFESERKLKFSREKIDFRLKTKID
jgi:hypothetical protein